MLCQSPDWAEYHSINSDVVEAKAAAEGLIVSLPDADELQIDIDSDADWRRFQRSWEIMQREFCLDDCRVTPSRNGGEGRHVRIRMRFPLGPWERIALQASLGSDPVRELLSCVRLVAGDPRPTLLLERADFV